MKTVSIDQALLHSAIAIFEDGRYLTHYSWTLKRKENTDEICYDAFFHNINLTITREKPDKVICEKMYLGFNAKIYGMLQELVGIIRAICIMNNVEFEAIPTATYRSKLGVKNKKADVSEFIAKSFPELIINNDDESDAIALGLAHCIMLEERKNAQTSN